MVLRGLCRVLWRLLLGGLSVLAWGANSFRYSSAVGAGNRWREGVLLNSVKNPDDMLIWCVFYALCKVLIRAQRTRDNLKWPCGAVG